MAEQLKTLKFSDNVLQVKDSYQVTTHGTTYSDPNVKLGTFYIADSCGDITLHATNNYPGFVMKDRAGKDYVRLGFSCGNVTGSFPSITFYDVYEDNARSCVAIGAYCGNLSVKDACGDEMLYVRSESYGTVIGAEYRSPITLGTCIMAGVSGDYSSPNGGSGFFVGSGIWMPDIGGLRVGCGSVYVDSDGFLKASGFNN